MSSFLKSLAPLAAGSVPGVDVVREALHKDSSHWFHWVLVSSGVVAIGVLFELPEGTVAIRRWWRALRGRDNLVENERSWVIPASYLGLVLVILGVGGEGIFETRFSIADTALQAHDSQKLAEAESEAGDAKQSAQEAEAAGERAKLTADGAERSADDALTKAANARAEAANAHREAEAVEMEAIEDLNIVRQHVREIPMQRSLNGRPPLAGENILRTELLNEVRKYSGTTFSIWAVPDDNEATGLAQQIQKELRSVGWRPFPVSLPVGVDVPGGVYVVTFSKPVPLPPVSRPAPVPSSKAELAAAALTRLLALDLNFVQRVPVLPGDTAFRGVQGSTMLRNDLLILVGPKPQSDPWPNEFVPGRSQGQPVSKPNVKP